MIVAIEAQHVAQRGHIGAHISGRRSWRPLWPQRRDEPVDADPAVGSSRTASTVRCFAALTMTCSPPLAYTSNGPNGRNRAKPPKAVFYCRAITRIVARRIPADPRPIRSRPGIIDSNEHLTHLTLPCDCHPAAGHPLPDLPQHRRLQTRPDERHHDRALPPRASRGACRRSQPVALTGFLRCYRSSQERTLRVRKSRSAGMPSGLPARWPQMLGIVASAPPRR